MWIWHAYFGMPGSHNDINVLDTSPLFNNLLNRTAPKCEYHINHLCQKNPSIPNGGKLDLFYPFGMERMRSWLQPAQMRAIQQNQLIQLLKPAHPAPIPSSPSSYIQLIQLRYPAHPAHPAPIPRSTSSNTQLRQLQYPAHPAHPAHPAPIPSSSSSNTQLISSNTQLIQLQYPAHPAPIPSSPSSYIQLIQLIQLQ